MDLFAGYEMSGAETEDVTLRWPTQLIVLAGAEGSGKTTMLAALYEHLGRGSFAGFDFAGSRSLLGFEKICHANRVVSGGTRPTTERTIPSDEAAYYHLALRETSGDRRRRQVLLSALSGEQYGWARNSREECEKLTFLRRANAIVVLVDGAKLASLEHRNSAHTAAAGILDAFLDAEMVPSGCHVEFVFSKLDRIRGGGDVALGFLKQTQDKLEAKFRAHVPHLAFREIAVRPGPTNDDEDHAKGLASALATWASPRTPSRFDDERAMRPSSDAREFSKYGWRRSDEARRAKP
ncbi:MAG: hypothetical protein K8T90_09070 [Planctomycetes bacterium]|nr:hypothetical protein [Planctomycetota bacterium]